MKGVKKCFLYLFTLTAVSLVSCLGICSHNTSALKHNYSSLNFTTYDLYDTSGNSLNHLGTGNLNVEYPQNLGSSSHPSLPSQSIKRISDPCYQSPDSYVPISTNTTTTTELSLRIVKQAVLHSDGSLSGYSGCHSIDRTNWYEYDSIRIERASDSPNSTDGTISDIFKGDDEGVLPAPISRTYTMYRFGLPLTFNQETVGPMTQGRDFHFHFEFASDDFFYKSSGGNLLESGDDKVTFNYQGVAADHTYYSGYFSWADAGNPSNTNYCTNLVVNANNKKLSADCYWQPPADLAVATLKFTVSSSSYPSPRTTPVWYNTSFVFFDNFYVVTDNDETPGGDASLPMTGNNVSSSPGYAETMGETYSYSLQNLFGFSFLNPFSPLFNMFTSGESCASIPIIAGMIGSTETSYCPWFSADTRNILTPVLSISAMMVIFGFAVRWLGSSSGNNFEDKTNKGDQ